MATTNPFDLLGDNDSEDPSLLIAVQLPKKAPASAQVGAVAAQNAKSAKLPSKPLPPAQAVREAKSDYGRRGSRGGGRDYGRGGNRNGGSGFNHDSLHNENPVGNNGFSGGYRPSDNADGGRASERRSYGGPPRGSFRGGRRGGFNNGEATDEERPRAYDRRSGTGRGYEIKRDGSGRGNWGAASDEIIPEGEETVVEKEKNIDAEKQLVEEEVVETNKEVPVTEEKEPEPEDKEMTLEEYEKVVEEKRKSLIALKSEERKVDVDKEFKAMQPLSCKKDNNDIFIKLGSEKDKRKDAADKEEKAKKSVSINEFLKPAEGERYYNPSGRGRGRGRGRGHGSREGFGGGDYRNKGNNAPAIEDPGQFPSLGVK